MLAVYSMVKEVSYSFLQSQWILRYLHSSYLVTVLSLGWLLKEWSKGNLNMVNMLLISRHLKYAYYDSRQASHT